jgi:thymidylate synthase
MSRKTEDFVKLSKFWAKLDNGDGSINSSYYYLLKGLQDHGDPILEARRSDNGIGIHRTPWDWALQALKSDKDTRQAFMRISRPEHQWRGCADQPCTMHLTWSIREDKLHLSTVMRANDVVKGTVYDIPFFMMLMEEMLLDLKSTYPNIQIGSYTHFAHSMHIYSSSLEIAKNMLG